MLFDPSLDSPRRRLLIFHPFYPADPHRCEFVKEAAFPAVVDIIF
jgi:hypothetical protein